MSQSTEHPTSETSCMECGMQVRIDQYHPYAACLMFKQCHDSEVVEANLKAVIAHGFQIAWETPDE